MESLSITIDAEGNVVVAVGGIKGKSCKDVTRQIEKALGSVTSDKLTSEYQEVERVRAKN